MMHFDPSAVLTDRAVVKLESNYSIPGYEDLLNFFRGSRIMYRVT